MRILHLISSIYFFGAERVVAELAAVQPALGADVHVGVISRDEKLIEIFRKVIADPAVSVQQFDGSGMVNFSTIRELSRYILEHRIQIVHSHGYKSDIYAFLVRFIFRHKVYLVATNHNWIGTTPRENIYQRIDSAVLRSFNRIIAVSEDVRQQMLNAGIRAEKIAVIDNGINVDDYALQTTRKDAASALNVEQHAFVVGNIARLTPEKDQAALIEAVMHLHDINDLILVLVGDGPDFENLQELIRSRGLEKRVVMTGNRDDARMLYAAFDVFALVSTNEGLPMVLLEAMAARVPVIATRVGAIPEVVTDKENGLLVDPSQPEELIKALRCLYADKNSRLAMAEAGREMVTRVFSSRRMAERYMGQYSEQG